METSNKNSKRVNRVNNKVAFSNGDERRPEYAILLPNGHSVLCRAGMNLGITALISRREADKKGVNYLRPLKWASSSLFVYPNNEVRDEKGTFVGTYLGQNQDDFSRPFISSSDFGGTMHSIFVRKDDGVYRINYSGKTEKIDAIDLILGRLFWGSLEEIAIQGDRKDDPENEEEERAKVADKIRALAELPATALRAALQLQELQKRQEERRQQLRLLDMEELDATPVFTPKKRSVFFLSDEEKAEPFLKTL